ncbi:hypothetical protein, partial [Flexithrix dorotheae]|uniref:hypothetical protein n=1 Tax=Flexithrix dorotheae TaxID=70993 RepID=UPI001B7FE7D1
IHEELVIILLWPTFHVTNCSVKVRLLPLQLIPLNSQLVISGIFFYTYCRVMKLAAMPSYLEGEGLG